MSIVIEMSNHYWNKRSLLNLFNKAHSGQDSQSTALGILGFTFFSLRRFFSFYFSAKMSWNHVFCNMGKMKFLPETSWVSHTIAFHANLHFRHSSRVGGAKCVFFVCERNFEWCRVHGEGVKGPQILISFRIPENYRTSRMSSYSMVWQSTFWVFASNRRTFQ